MDNIAALNEQINAIFDRYAVGGSITGTAYDSYCEERDAALRAAGVSLAEWHSWCEAQDAEGFEDE